MQPDQILHSSLLDIVFENRNKAYGAYSLRKAYPTTLFKALGFVGLVVAVFSIWMANQKSPKGKALIPEIMTRHYSMPVAEPAKKKEKIKLPVKPQHPVAAKKAHTQLFVSRIRMVDNSDKSNLPKNLDSAAISTVTQQGPTAIFTALPIVRPQQQGTVAGNVLPAVNREQPLSSAEVMPSFPGGMEALRTFLQRHLNNPRDIESGEDVAVKIAFVVGYDGKLKKFEVLQDGGKLFNEEVIRVLKMMPDWIPGKTRGENVSVYYAIPVKFVPNE